MYVGIPKDKLAKVERQHKATYEHYYKNGVKDMGPTHKAIELIKDEEYYRNIIRNNKRYKIHESAVAYYSKMAWNPLDMNEVIRTGVDKMPAGWYKTGTDKLPTRKDVILSIAENGVITWYKGGYIHCDHGPAFISRGFTKTQQDWYWRGYRLEVDTLQEFAVEVHHLRPHWNEYQRERPIRAEQKREKARLMDEEAEKLRQQFFTDYDRLFCYTGMASFGGGSGDAYIVVQPLFKYDSRNKRIADLADIWASDDEYAVYRIAKITKRNRDLVKGVPEVATAYPGDIYEAVKKSASRELASKFERLNSRSIVSQPSSPIYLSYPNTYYC